MPRRKKKAKEALEFQNPEKDAGSVSSDNAKKKRRQEDNTFIVISDSDGEEPNEENRPEKTKTKQPDRAKCLARREIAQMTEEEQFALALKMSEQEAREADNQEEEEEALLRKAIAESLHSCRPSDPPATASGPLATRSSSQSHQEKTTDSGTTEGILQLIPPSPFKDSHVSQGNKTEGREAPWDHNENTQEEPVSGSSEQWDQSSQPVSENENAKCFDNCIGHLAELSQCEKPQESTGRECAFPRASQGREDTSRHCLPAPQDAKNLQDVGGTVHYFWGIPFCPAGVDPNQYTKVILCQLEVYQKSLKMAQRQLLKKKEFGEPVLPRPPSLTQSEYDQGDQASEKNEGTSEDMGDEDSKEERQESRAAVWHSETKDFHESSLKSSKEKLLLEEEPTASHGQSSQGLFVEETSEEGSSVPDSKSTAALTSKRSPVLMPESSAEEITVCPETPSSPETSDLVREHPRESREATERVKLMADKQVGNRAGAEKKVSASVFSPSSQVSCPLCNQGFPLSKIEVHAMYCNGHKGQDTVLTRSQREAKSKNESGPAAQTAFDTDKNEKCYICKSLVPLREYHCHVEACLQLARSDLGDAAAEGQSWCSTVKGKPRPPPRNPKEKRHNGGRLLSRLEQSEHRNAGAGVKAKSSDAGASRVPPPGLEVASCSRETQSSLAHLSLSDSPIKSFVSISEATDCLVDFKKQLTVRSGNRTRTRAARGRRRKS